MKGPALELLQPGSLDEALAAKASHPEAVPLAGGTDLMVAVNFDRIRPDVFLDLTRVRELKTWERSDGVVRLGAGVTFTTLVSELSRELPGLSMASRTVGSPQIRNRGTVGGNLGTSSPAGDALPPLVAAGAEIELASRAGRRVVPIEGFIVGPKKNALAPDELITSIRIPVATGPQQFAKIGTRNAMVIAVASFALNLDPATRTVRTAIGSAGPVILRAHEAESFLAHALGDEEMWTSPSSFDELVAERFGELVAQAASPIDDVRGTARYPASCPLRAARTLSWAWADLGEAA